MKVILNKEDIRNYLAANLFDGNDGGVLTVRVSPHLDDLAEVVFALMTDAEIQKV